MSGQAGSISPLPWRIVVRNGVTEILDARGDCVADDETYHPAAVDADDAAYIVLAANAYPGLQSQVRALREALHAAVDSWDRSNAERRHAGLIPLPDSHGPAWLKVARQALVSSPQPQQETR